MSTVSRTTIIKSDIANSELAAQGKKRIEWAERSMPVLAQIRDRFTLEQPFKGVRISACMHVTTETANLMRTLKAGGANVFLAASNPLSTQDDVAAALVNDYSIPTFAIKGESTGTFFKHIDALIAQKPQLTMDDGADLVSTIHKQHPDLLAQMIGGCRLRRSP